MSKTNKKQSLPAFNKALIILGVTLTVGLGVVIVKNISSDTEQANAGGWTIMKSAAGITLRGCRISNSPSRGIRVLGTTENRRGIKRPDVTAIMWKSRSVQAAYASFTPTSGGVTRTLDPSVSVSSNPRIYGSVNWEKYGHPYGSTVTKRFLSLRSC